MVAIDAVAAALEVLGAMAPVGLGGCKLRGRRLEGTSMGWFKCDADIWPSLMANIPKPWPVEVALADLAWWEQRVAFKVCRKVPGRPLLRRRWGWTDYRVHQLLLGEGWHRFNSSSTARQQFLNSPREVEPAQSAQNQQFLNSPSTENLHTRVGVEEEEKRRTTEPPTESKEVARLVRLVVRWSGPEAPDARRWNSIATRDHDWLRKKLPEWGGVDVVGQLGAIDNWLEGKAGSAQFWTAAGWKNGITRWMGREVERVGPADRSGGFAASVDDATRQFQARFGK